MRVRAPAWLLRLRLDPHAPGRTRQRCPHANLRPSERASQVQQQQQQTRLQQLVSQEGVVAVQLGLLLRLHLAPTAEAKRIVQAEHRPSQQHSSLQRQLLGYWQS